MTFDGLGSDGAEVGLDLVLKSKLSTRTSYPIVCVLSAFTTRRAFPAVGEIFIYNSFNVDLESFLSAVWMCDFIANGTSTKKYQNLSKSTEVNYSKPYSMRDDGVPSLAA